MGFLKKLFGGSKESPRTESTHPDPGFAGAYTKEYFQNRYTEKEMDAKMLNGCMKMIESYLADNKLTRRIDSPFNHPLNLDQVDQDGFGFVLYCRQFQLNEEMASMMLAYGFSDFLMKKYGFKLYQDAEPEYPLRGMTLKYNKNGAVLSLYPYEYATKVLGGNETFTAMDEKLAAQLLNLPSSDDVINRMMNDGE